MTEEVYPGIFRIGVVLPNNPLKEINDYYIPGESFDLLIDTGFRADACREALEAGLSELGSKKERRRVLVSHLHSDHSGMADLFAGEEEPVYMSAVDTDCMLRHLSGEHGTVRDARFVTEGFAPELVAESLRNNPAVRNAMPGIDDRFVRIQDGDKIEAGPYTLTTVQVPGHTPGNCMFYIESERVMFTGDHVLFDITPNITYWPGMDDSLGTYLEQLDRALAFDVTCALPGHRKTGDYRERIRALQAHHAKRLQDALDIIAAHPGSTAYEITGRMKWKIRADSWETFPATQKFFAFGECLSHLDYHRLRGRIRRTMEDGVYRYTFTEEGKIPPE